MICTSTTKGQASIARLAVCLKSWVTAAVKISPSLTRHHRNYLLDSLANKSEGWSQKGQLFYRMLKKWRLSLQLNTNCATVIAKILLIKSTANFIWGICMKRICISLIKYKKVYITILCLIPLPQMTNNKHKQLVEEIKYKNILILPSNNNRLKYSQKRTC